MNNINRRWLVVNITCSIALAFTLWSFLPNAVNNITQKQNELEHKCKEFDEVVESFYIAQQNLLLNQKHFKKIQEDFQKEQLRSLKIMTDFQKTLLHY